MQFRLRPFDMEYPTTAREAVEMRDGSHSSCFLTGGTHLVPTWRTAHRPPQLVINLKRICMWDRPETTAGLWLNPVTTVADLRGVLPVSAAFGGLGAALSEFGSPLVQPLATVAGNLAAAQSDSTLAAPLIALDTRIFYDSIVGPGMIRADDLFEKPGLTTLPHGALITGIEVPAPPESARGEHLAIRTGLATSTPVVAASAVVEIDPEGRVTGGRLSIAHATPTPREVWSAREILGSGSRLSEIAGALGDAAVDAVEPDDDRWATARYRQRMARVVTERLVRSISHSEAEMGAGR